MTEPDAHDPVRRALRLHAPGPDAPAAACLDDHVLAALADGTIDAAARAAALPHLAACARCRLAVASVARALADPAVAGEVGKAGRPARPWRRLALVALPAAAAVALLVVGPWRREPGEPIHRAPTITAAIAPAPRAPVGMVADARRLHWTPVAEADRYRVTLFDDAGRVLFESEETASSVTIPDSIVLAAGRPYLWKVEARTGFDRWSASDLVEFTIAPEAPR